MLSRPPPSESRLGEITRKYSITDKIDGEILRRLEEEGLADNTVVFLFGDNGRPHLSDKQFLYEGGLHVPLIIRWSKEYTPSVDDQLVSTIDVTAQSFKLAGIDVPKHFHGNLFLGNKAKKRESVYGFRQRSGDAVDNMRSIFDGRHRLIWNRRPDIPWMQMSGYKKSEYPAYTLYYQMFKAGELNEPFSNFMASEKPEIELFDVENDPMEFNNLADNEDYKKIKDKLLTTLSENLKEFDKNKVQESPETIEKAIKSSRKYYKSKVKQMKMTETASDDEFDEYWEKKLLYTTSN